jgi:hypothetical protein
MALACPPSVALPPTLYIVGAVATMGGMFVSCASALFWQRHPLTAAVPLAASVLWYACANLLFWHKPWTPWPMLLMGVIFYLIAAVSLLEERI